MSSGKRKRLKSTKTAGKHAAAIMIAEIRPFFGLKKCTDEHKTLEDGRKCTIRTRLRNCITHYISAISVNSAKYAQSNSNTFLTAKMWSPDTWRPFFVLFFCTEIALSKNHIKTLKTRNLAHIITNLPISLPVTLLRRIIHTYIHVCVFRARTSFQRFYTTFEVLKSAQCCNNHWSIYRELHHLT